MSEHQKEPDKKQPGLGSIILSTLAAAFGVQSSKNRERDFVKGNLKSYVISGLIFVVIFISSIVMLVKFLIQQAST
jgi:uncharacterized membrane protein